MAFLRLVVSRFYIGVIDDDQGSITDGSGKVVFSTLCSKLLNI